MLSKLYKWTLNFSRSKYALLALATIALIESSIFPIPPDVLLIPMVLAFRERAWIIAIVCTLMSVFGGVFGYGIGYYAYDYIGKPLLEFYHSVEKFHEFQNTYNEWGAWAVFFAGITPFPYKVITILSGATGLNLVVFIISSVLARGIRFFIIAALLWKYGDAIRSFIEKRLGILFLLFVVFLLGGFIVLKYLV